MTSIPIIMINQQTNTTINIEHTQAWVKERTDGGKREIFGALEKDSLDNGETEGHVFGGRKDLFAVLEARSFDDRKAHGTKTVDGGVGAIKRVDPKVFVPTGVGALDGG